MKGKFIKAEVPLACQERRNYFGRSVIRWLSAGISPGIRGLKGTEEQEMFCFHFISDGDMRYEKGTLQSQDPGS